MSRKKSVSGRGTSGIRRRGMRSVKSAIAASAFEALEQRAMFASVPGIAISFDNGVLSVIGNSNSNGITISRNAAGQIFVNNDALKLMQKANVTVANTSAILISGNGGNDNIVLNESNGALPAASLFGGAGNDTLIAGSGNDFIDGGADNDILQGKGGSDSLFGGSGNDTETGGDGDDEVFGQAGDDRMIWNPGEDTDLNEGGADNDTVEVNGGNGTESFTVTANGTRVRFDRLTPAPFSLDIGTTEQLVLNANGGDDSFSATGNLAPLIQLTIDGGNGNDSLLGGNGADVILGGDGNDFIDGNQGNDTAFMGAGDDVFQWDPGDGSDVVEGQEDADRMLFNGSAANETFTAFANGDRTILTRTIANIVMDLNDVETMDINALGGADAMLVRDLSGTDLTKLNVNLSGSFNGTAGDSAADVVQIDGTGGDDVIDVFGSGSSVSVVAPHTTVNVTNAEGANDALVVNAMSGADGITATTLPAGVIKLTEDGGAGDDVLLGSQGADIIFGGDDSDFVSGGQGNDSIFLGEAHDVMQWNPGEGSDVVEGQGGDDQMLFFGANINENFEVSANGGRVRLTRDVANITMDINDIETIELRAQAGADNIVIGDMTGTDLTRFDADLRATAGGGDGAADTISVNGTQGADAINVGGNIGGMTVSGLHTTVNIFRQEVANDRLTVNALGGDDVINASSLTDDGIQLTENGGLGADIMVGSAGGDLLTGGDGADTALMGAGNDTFVWNPGDDNDTIEGQADRDTMLFNGANIAEAIDISANGGRVRFTRNVANVVMDLNDTEVINFNALGGADTITVGDHSSTDLIEANLNLAATGGAGDGAADSVIVNATNGDDTATVSGDGFGTSVIGLSARVNITGTEAANDRLTINALAGDDVIDGTGLTANAIAFTADGGDDDDVLIGGAGNDILRGGAGDDVLIGNDGNDVLDGGTGSNILIQ